MTDVFARVSGSWVGNAGDPNNPPPDEQPRFAGHVPGRVILGMCVQQGAQGSDPIWLEYDEAVSYVGTPFARRSFGNGSWVTAAKINAWINECNVDSTYPWISFKVPSNNWAGVINGQYDSGLDIIIERANARPEQWAFSVHHEPTNDGDLTVWAAMQEYISDYVAEVSDKVALITVANGFAWGPENWDANVIAQSSPPSLIAALNRNNHVFGADHYDSADATKLDYTRYDRTSRKIQSWIEWGRANGVKTMAIGEFGCHTAEDMRRCWNLFAENSDIFALAEYFNSGANIRANWLLVPDAFNAPETAADGISRDGSPETEARMDMFIEMLAASEDVNPSTIAP